MARDCALTDESLGTGRQAAGGGCLLGKSAYLSYTTPAASMIERPAALRLSFSNFFSRLSTQYVLHSESVTCAVVASGGPVESLAIIANRLTDVGQREDAN